MVVHVLTGKKNLHIKYSLSLYLIGREQRKLSDTQVIFANDNINIRYSCKGNKYIWPFYLSCMVSCDIVSVSRPNP